MFLSAKRLYICRNQAHKLLQPIQKQRSGRWIGRKSCSQMVMFPNSYRIKFEAQVLAVFHKSFRKHSQTSCPWYRWKVLFLLRQQVLIVLGISVCLSRPRETYLSSAMIRVIRSLFSDAFYSFPTANGYSHKLTLM